MSILSSKRVPRYGFLCILLVAPACAPRALQVSGEIVGRDRLALLLSRIVAGDTVDFEKLLENRQLVDAYLARVLRQGPETTPEDYPDRDSRLAYAINCHNVMMLRALIALAGDGAIPPRVPGDVDRRFFFPVDGRLRTAAEMRATALALAEGDWRVRLALYRGRRNGPPLGRRPFLADVLDMQLEQAARSALASDRVVRIDHGADKRLLLWQGLFEIRDRLIDDYERRYDTTDATMLSVLMEWSDPFRRRTLNSAVGYPVAAMPREERLP